MSGPKAHEWIEQLTPYKPGDSKLAGQERVVKLSANESAFGISEAALKAAAAAADGTRYKDSTCLKPREAIADIYDLDKDRIVCGNGSDELLMLLARAFAGPGDEVIYCRPGFMLYPLAAKAVGAVGVEVALAGDEISVDAILAAVTPRTKLVYIDNPNNPVGTLLTGDELRRLHAGIPSEAILVVDAAYAESVTDPAYDDGSALVDQFENVVMTRTFSKLYAMAGLRFGWIYCPSHIADILNRLRDPYNVSGPAQAAAAAAVQDTDHLKAAQDYTANWRDDLTARLVSMGLRVVPSQTNFLLVEFPSETGSTAEEANAWLRKNGYILRWLPEQGLSNYLRLTIGTPEQNNGVIQLLREFMDGSGHLGESL